MSSVSIYTISKLAVSRFCARTSCHGSHQAIVDRDLYDSIKHRHIFPHALRKLPVLKINMDIAKEG